MKPFIILTLIAGIIWGSIIVWDLSEPNCTIKQRGSHMYSVCTY